MCAPPSKRLLQRYPHQSPHDVLDGVDPSGACLESAPRLSCPRRK
jgi:hypothetical protein